MDDEWNVVPSRWKSDGKTRAKTRDEHQRMFEMLKNLYTKYHNSTKVCCICCNIQISDPIVGHVIAASKGGLFIASNLRLTCKSCEVDTDIHTLKPHKMQRKFHSWMFGMK